MVICHKTHNLEKCVQRKSELLWSGGNAYIACIWKPVQMHAYGLSTVAPFHPALHQSLQ